MGTLHIVSAWACENGISLGQVAVDGKSNEITAIPKLLEMLDLLGVIISLDAMGCQREIAAQIHEGKGDYVLALKGNQEHLYEDAQAAFEPARIAEVQELQEKALISPMPSDPPLDQESILNTPKETKEITANPESKTETTPSYDHYETQEAKHGRREVRRVEVIGRPSGMRTWEKWLGAQSIIKITYVRYDGKKETEEIRYYISSLKVSAKRFGEIIRRHWSIENQLHWVLDVVFREDESRMKGNAAQNMAWMRKMALALLKRLPGKDSLRTKRQMVGWDENLLEQILHDFLGFQMR